MHRDREREIMQQGNKEKKKKKKKVRSPQREISSVMTTFCYCLVGRRADSEFESPEGPSKQ